MNEHLSNFLFGVLGGGLVATGIRIAETYWLAPRFTESAEARKKLFLYARPLSHACHELEYRPALILIKGHITEVFTAHNIEASLLIKETGLYRSALSRAAHNWSNH